MARRWFALLCSLITLFCAPLLYGQSTSATITGFIADQTKGVMVGVKVDAVNQDTNVHYSSTTNNEGSYTVANLPPGNYKIEVEKQGFKSIIKPDVILHVQDAVAINFTMAVGSASESITVGAAGPTSQDVTVYGEPIDINPAVSTVIDQTLIENMPLNGRSLDTLFELTPGVVATNGLAGGYTVNGQRATANNLTIDGASANIFVPLGSGEFAYNFGGVNLPLSASGGTNGVLPIDAIEEYRIQTSTYAAEFGRTPGGQIQVKSRGGSDDFHGTLFEYFRNQVLDATDWFVGHDHEQQPPLRMNDFGGTLGGPVLKGKVFFFVAHETLLLRQPQFASYDVPDANSIQTASPVFKSLLSAFPIGNGGPDPNNPGTDIYNQPFSNVITDHSTSVRADASISSKVHLFERVNIAPSSNTNNFETNPSIYNMNYYTSTTGATYTFNTKISDEMTFGFAHSNGLSDSILTNVGGSDVATASKYVDTLFDTSTGFFSFSGPGGANFGYGASMLNRQNQWNLVDTVSISKGNHLIKAGVDYRRTIPIFESVPSLYLQSGQNSLSNLQSGTVETLFYSAMDPNFASFPFHYWNLSLFAQDSWKVTPRLTLDYGLRWDINPPPTDGHGGPLAFTGSAQDPASLQIAPPGTPLWKTPYGNVAPRLGGAYEIRAVPKFETVLRGGFGTFYDTGTSAAASNTLWMDYPYGFSAELQNVPFSSIDFKSITTQGPSLPGYFLYANDPHMKSPFTYEWSVSVDQAIGGGTSLSASYIGNSGHRLLSGIYAGNLNSLASNLIVQTDTARSSYEALQLQLNTKIGHSLQGYVSYTWSHALDTIDNEYFVPGVNQTQLGNAGFDIRHIFSAAVHWETPGLTQNRAMEVLVGGWSTDFILHVQSAAPLTVIGANDPLLGFGGGSEPRAEIVPGVPVIISNPNAPGGKQLNPAAFRQPPSGQEGDSPVNYYRLFGLAQFDFALSRTLLREKRFPILFRADAFNLFNTPNFSQANTYLPSPTFGQAGNTYAGSFSSISPGTPGLNQVFANGGPRNIQLSLKLKF